MRKSQKGKEPSRQGQQHNRNSAMRLKKKKMASVLGKVSQGPDRARFSGLFTVWLHVKGDGEPGRARGQAERELS